VVFTKLLWHKRNAPSGAFVQKMRPIASGVESETGAHFCAGK
jgi:hypothetical protein